MGAANPAYSRGYSEKKREAKGSSRCSIWEKGVQQVYCLGGGTFPSLYYYTQQKENLEMDTDVKNSMICNEEGLSGSH